MWKEKSSFISRSFQQLISIILRPSLRMKCQSLVYKWAADDIYCSRDKSENQNKTLQKIEDFKTKEHFVSGVSDIVCHFCHPVNILMQRWLVLCWFLSKIPHRKLVNSLVLWFMVVIMPYFQLMICTHSKF